MTQSMVQGQGLQAERGRAGLRAFVVVWAGQVASLLGSTMTGFALGVWIFQQTGSVTNFALTLLFNMLPKALVAPAAGVLADRYDRRRIMIAADAAAGLTTLATALLFLGGRLAVWHIYLFTALNAGFSALQGPAFGAAVSQLVPKAQYGRANGLLQLGEGVAQLAAPLAAGALLAATGLRAVLLVDMVTFFVAVAALLAVRFPPYTPDRDAAGPSASSWRQLGAAWRYLRARPGLLGLVLVFAAVNFFVGVAEAALTPMVLSFASAAALGLILTAGGVGMLAGSLALSAWGGGQRKVVAVFGAYALLAVGVVLAGVAPSVPLVAFAAFVAFFFLPTVMGASRAILQAKVDLTLQGRVFGLTMMLNTLSFALAYLLGGPLADWVFEPLLAVNGPLANVVGPLIGVGPGRGMGLMFIVMGLLALATALAAFAHPRIRRVETELPDAG